MSKNTLDLDRMHRLRDICFDTTRPKGERQPLFSELRALEKKLGYPSRSYNGDGDDNV